MPIIDPNIVYLVVVVALWLGVTASYIPGTGLTEVLAVAALIGSGVMLVNLPTNWVAVVLIAIGVSGFIVIPLVDRKYANFALGGLALQVIGGWLLFDGLTVSPILIGLTVIIPALYHQYLLLPMLDKVREPVLTEDDLLVGASGRVVKALNPTGTVQARGELWTAVSNQPLEAGSEVVIVEREGLLVHVEGIKHKRSELNGHE